ncbi:MAG TPA: VOC family protein [Bacteroidia bacterium]|nr:VOC family protein [Bacteroidia bacterium]
MIAWFEIPASDFEKTVSFYSRILETPVEVHVFNNQRHGIFVHRPGQIGGSIVESEPAEKRNGPVLFFRVRDDISSVLDRVEACGGKIIMPRTLIRNIGEDKRSVIPRNLIDQKIGYYAVFEDPEGNRMALYTSH